jgi:sulfide:quinone oxidoreductase
MKDLSGLSRKGIGYMNAEVTKIDPENREVKTSAKDVNYDYLIVSLGADLVPQAVPGFVDAAFNLYDLNHLTQLRDTLAQLSHGTLTILISSTPFRCPAAPYEAALLVDAFLRKKGVRKNVGIQVYTPEPFPMPVAGQAVGDAVKSILEQRDIKFYPSMKPVSVNAKKKQIDFEKGDQVGFDLLMGVPVHKSAAVVRETKELSDQSGWVPVDKGTMRTRYDDVFAIGDVTAIKLPSGMMLPKAGVFAHYQAEVVTHNIVADIQGGSKTEFDGRGYCFLETGHGKAGFASGNFYSAPTTTVKLRSPSRIWHWGKILFEKYWMWRWF